MGSAMEIRHLSLVGGRSSAQLVFSEIISFGWWKKQCTLVGQQNVRLFLLSKETIYTSWSKTTHLVLLVDGRNNA